MANENSIDVYHALMALEEKVKGVAPDPENVTTDVALALADIFRTDAPMAQETAIVNAIDTVTANYSGGGGVDVGPMTDVPQGYIGRILVGEDVDFDALLYFDEGIIYVSDTAIALNPTGAAAGTTARLTYYLSVTQISGIPITGVAGFVVTFVDPDASPQTFATVRPWDGTITYTAENDLLTLTCIMPELESDEALWIHVITAD